MANLLNNPDLWVVTGADYSGGAWHLNIDGAHSERPNGNLTTSYSPGAGNLVAGTVAYEVTDYDSPLDYLYCVVYVSGKPGFSQLIYSPGDPLPKSGSFDFSVSTDGGAYVSIGAGTDANSDPAYNVTGQYISIGELSITPTADPPTPGTRYNCECDDGQPTVTLQQMRNRLARRLGFSVQVSMGALPPGMPELLDDFIRSAHELMYHRYSVMRLRRMFTWDMVAGQQFYDIDGNRDDCPRILNPDKLEWVGISQGDSSWRPLICGINPVLYGSAATGIPSHYEIRQCIEVWPAPADDTWQLRIKGDFGATTLEADDDVLTADPEAVFLQALANAKAHYGQADAANYASQATAYVRSRVAGSHQTRRYIPGSCVQPPAVPPLLKED
ncbi:hypothetical protein [Stenotrophomonas sp.]|uniref:phage adaptor protein n=1 Tax=Stenotrophomonas sp. TaxID=69392 RepID=UPI0028AFD631|nr:hypothetical protein [Stenotrophomonas sp.]